MTKRHTSALPLRLIFREDLALRVVTNVTDLGEAADVELCRAELRHDGGSGIAMSGELTVCDQS